MSEGRLSQPGSIRSPQRINRVPYPVLARSIPWISIVLGSVVPSWFLIASTPVLPPFGFLMLVSWRQVRPGLLPVWAGLPLGLIDDLYSGQPMGSAILLWSATLIALDVVETNLPWRNFAMEWLVAAGLISAYIVLSLGFANVAGATTPFFVIVPQIVISVLIYPLIGRMVAALDRFRLTPFAELD